jgi:hypothetical protein
MDRTALGAGIIFVDSTVMVVAHEQIRDEDVVVPTSAPTTTAPTAATKYGLNNGDVLVVVTILAAIIVLSWCYWCFKEKVQRVVRVHLSI